MPARAAYGSGPKKLESAPLEARALAGMWFDGPTRIKKMKKAVELPLHAALLKAVCVYIKKKNKI